MTPSERRAYALGRKHFERGDVEEAIVQFTGVHPFEKSLVLRLVLCVPDFFLPGSHSLVLAVATA